MTIEKSRIFPAGWDGSNEIRIALMGLDCPKDIVIDFMPNHRVMGFRQLDFETAVEVAEYILSLKKEYAQTKLAASHWSEMLELRFKSFDVEFLELTNEQSVLKFLYRGKLNHEFCSTLDDINCDAYEINPGSDSGCWEITVELAKDLSGGF